MKAYLLIFLFALIGKSVNAQKVDTLSPGQVLPRWSNLKENTSKYSIFTTSKEGKILFFGMVERVVKPYPFNGKDTWISIQTSYTKESVDWDSTIFLPKTYVPVAYRTHIPTEKHKERVDFDGTKITAQIIYADSTVTKDQSSPYPLYSAVMTEVIMQAIPFTKGGKFAIRSLNPGAHYRGATTMVFEVLDEEKIDVAGTDIDCWKISSGKSIMWYSKKTQELIKQQFAMPNGNTWTKMKML